MAYGGEKTMTTDLVIMGPKAYAHYMNRRVTIQELIAREGRWIGGEKPKGTFDPLPFLMDPRVRKVLKEPTKPLPLINPLDGMFGWRKEHGTPDAEI